MIYVTGNDKKFEEAKLVLKKFSLTQEDLELPEIQGKPEDIIYVKALAAWDILQQPFIVEDVCFEAEALCGMPGPYIKDFLAALTNQNKTLHNIVAPLGNTRAHSFCHVAYVKGEEDIVFATGKASGDIVAPKGNLDHGKVSFNKVFKPDGYDKTYGEMSMSEHALYSARSYALQELSLKISSHKGAYS